MNALPNSKIPALPCSILVKIPIAPRKHLAKKVIPAVVHRIFPVHSFRPSAVGKYCLAHLGPEHKSHLPPQPPSNQCPSHPDPHLIPAAARHAWEHTPTLLAMMSSPVPAPARRL